MYKRDYGFESKTSDNAVGTVGMRHEKRRGGTTQLTVSPEPERSVNAQVQSGSV